jgi:hypothetical protein
MSDLVAARISRIHQAFLDASARFPQLHFLAITDSPDFDIETDPHWRWPMTVRSPEWHSISRWQGCSPLSTTGVWLGDQRGGKTGDPPYPSTTWNGAFVYRHPRRPQLPWATILGKRKHAKGIDVFIDLATTASGYFLPPGVDDYAKDHAETSWIGDEKRWLAQIWQLGLFESISDDRHIILRLRADIFGMSAVAVEMLSAKGDTQAVRDAMAVPVNVPLSELVTLDQVAPLTGLSKRSLERYLSKGALPEPDARGGNGRANKWQWHNIRPALAKIAKKSLPEVFPGSRFI